MFVGKGRKEFEENDDIGSRENRPERENRHDGHNLHPDKRVEKVDNNLFFFMISDKGRSCPEN